MYADFGSHLQYLAAPTQSPQVKVLLKGREIMPLLLVKPIMDDGKSHALMVNGTGTLENVQKVSTTKQENRTHFYFDIIATIFWSKIYACSITLLNVCFLYDANK